MSKSEREYIPLPKVEQDQPADNIEIRLNLPGYIDQDKIGINLSRMSKICSISGIQTLRITGVTDKEKSEEIPEVVGINPDGSAIASKKIAKTEVSLSDYDKQNVDRYSYTICTRTIDVNINLDLDEMSKKVSNSKEGIRSVSGWSKSLDKGIRTPLRTAGTQNLLLELSQRDRLGVGMEISFGILLGGGIIEASNIGQAIVAGTFPLLAWGVQKSFESMAYRGNPDFRASAFLGPQLDRAVALRLVSRKPLVKDITVNK